MHVLCILPACVYVYYVRCMLFYVSVTKAYKSRLLLHCETYKLVTMSVSDILLILLQQLYFVFCLFFVKKMIEVKMYIMNWLIAHNKHLNLNLNDIS